MKFVILFICSITIITASIIPDSYVTFWVPQVIVDNQDYVISYLSTDNFSENDSKIEVQIGSLKSITPLSKGKFDHIVFPKMSAEPQTNVNAQITLYKDDTKRQCIRKNLKLYSNKKHFNTFIETNKQIYSPKEKILYRILVIDRDLKPYKINSLKIDIIDPSGKIVKTFQNSKNQYFGVFDGSYKIQNKAQIGSWKINVVVDNVIHEAVSRNFKVQFEEPRPFKFYADATNKNILYGSNVEFICNAHYWNGRNANGEIEFVFTDPQSSIELFRKRYQNVFGTTAFNINTISDLKLSRGKKIELDVSVVFRDYKTRVVSTQMIYLQVYGDNKNNMVVQTPEMFIPDQNFPVSVELYDWKWQPLTNQSDYADIVYALTINGQKSYQNYKLYTDGNSNIIEHEIKIPTNLTKLEVEVLYANCNTFIKSVDKVTPKLRSNELIVHPSKKFSKVNETVQITVVGDHDLNKIVVKIMVNSAPIEIFLVNCRYMTMCTFPILISESMLPNPTVHVYSVKEKNFVYYGKTILETENRGSNYLSMNLTSDIITANSKLQVNLQSRGLSTIYLFAAKDNSAYSKSYRFIANDNTEVTKANLDGVNHVFSFETKEWQDCSTQNTKKIQKRSYRRYYESDEDEASSEENESPEDTFSSDINRFIQPWIQGVVHADGSGFVSASIAADLASGKYQLSGVSIKYPTGIASAQPQIFFVIKNVGTIVNNGNMNIHSYTDK